jgi:glycosyltransferase involved in cell wall biosynthesis
MAMGVPVAAARSGGTPDLIEDGVTGVMFDPNSPESIRAAALKLFSDGHAAKAMAAAGKKRALERHHPVRIAEKHVEIYREILQERS